MSTSFKKVSIVLLVLVVITLSSCIQKPRYEFHTAFNDKMLIVFDNQTGTIHSKFVNEKKWGYEIAPATSVNKESSFERKMRKRRQNKE